MITFLAYGWDKWRARSRGRRVPEATLHVLALLGGWPGAWVGRAVFRHKTQKVGFTAILALITALHLAIASWIVWREFAG